MRKIFLSAGHSNKPGRDRGAAGNGFIEGELTALLREKVYNNLLAMGAPVSKDMDDTILSDSVRFFNKITTHESIVCEFHFNAGPESATGTETLVSVNPTYFEKKLAEAMSKAAHEVLGIPMRGQNGVKLETDSQHPNGLGWMRIPGQNILIEVCFISNPNEINRYAQLEDNLAEAYAKVLFTFANEKSPIANPTPEKIHKVRSGDTLTFLASIYHTTIEEIKKKNRLSDVDTIYIGQELKV